MLVEEVLVLLELVEAPNDPGLRLENDSKNELVFLFLLLVGER